MIIDKVYADGSKTVLLQKGDRVRILSVPECATWLIKKGDLGFVVGVENRKSVKQSSIVRLIVRTDAMISDNWGTVSFYPSDVEFVRT